MNLYRRLLVGTVLLAALGCGPQAEIDLDTDSETEPANAARFRGWIEPPITTVETTLSDGSVADIYMPTIPEYLRPLLEDQLPVVVLLQGGLVTKDQYSGYAQSLAGYGFVVAVPEKLRSFPPIFLDPVPLTEAGVIIAALDAVAALDADETSALYGVTDTDTAALTGHSFGGAISLNAIGGLCIPGLCTPPFDLPESVQAAALFGTNLTTDGVTTDIDSSMVSVALLQGDSDGVAVVEEAEATYGILEPTRALIIFEGLNHFGITNDNVIPGTNSDPSPQTVDQSVGIERLALWTALWFNAELRGSSLAAFWLFEFGGSFDGSVTVLSD